jgi:pilus assembly protein Flp/PilA
MQRAHAATARVKAWYLAANDAAHRVMYAEDGQGLAEYALILALIAIIAIIALIFLGGKISTVLSTVGKSI